MPQGYVSGNIAGVDITFEGDACKLSILDAGNFELRIIGSTSRGANGSVFNTLFENPSIPFGLEFTNGPIPLINDVIIAIQTSLASPSMFVVNLEDNRTHVNHDCVWDFRSQPYGPQFPKQRILDQYIETYVMRLIAVTPRS